MVKKKLTHLLSACLCSEYKILSYSTQLLLPLVNKIRPQSDIYAFFINELILENKSTKALLSLEQYAKKNLLSREKLNWCSLRVFSSSHDTVFKLKVLLSMGPYVTSLNAYDAMLRWCEGHRVDQQFISYMRTLSKLLNQKEITQSDAIEVLNTWQPIDIVIESNVEKRALPNIDTKIGELIEKRARTNTASSEIFVSDLTFYNVTKNEITYKAEPRENVVVFLESGATIEPIIESEQFQNSNFIIYGFQASDQGVQYPNVTVKSLRDLVPDNTDESRSIYSKTSQFIESISYYLRLLSNISQFCSPALIDAFLRTLDDKIATQLHLSHCFEKALQIEDSAERVIIVMNSGAQMMPMLPILEKAAGFGKIFVTSDSIGSDVIKSRYESLAKATESALNSAPEISDSKVEFPMDLNGIIPEIIERAEVCAALFPKGANIIASTDAPAYATATKELAKYLVSTGQDIAFYHNSLSEWDFARQYQMTHELGGESYTIDHGNLGAEVRKNRLLQGMVTELSELTIHHSMQSCRAAIKGAESLFYSVSKSFLNNQTLRGLAHYQFFDAFFQLVDCGSVFISSSRVANLGLMTVAAEEQGIKCVDYQVLNVHAHPKYRAPLTSYATVIDDVAADIYTSYLRYPVERLKIVGSPNLDQLVKKVNDADRQQVIAKLGIKKVSPNAILFASQLQPIERCESILKQLIRVSLETGCTLIVKPHPREENERIWVYRELIKEFGDPENMCIAQGCDVYDVIAITSLTVTMFSNVAREAYLCGHNVIVANYFGTVHPIQFDKEGLAYGAKSEEELVEIATRCVANQSSRQTNDYIKRNFHLTQMSASKEIVNFATEVSKLDDRKNALDGDREVVLNSCFNNDKQLYFSLIEKDCRLYQSALFNYIKSDMLSSQAVFFIISKFESLVENELLFETLNRVLIPLDKFIKQRNNLVTYQMMADEVINAANYLTSYLEKLIEATDEPRQSLLASRRKPFHDSVIVFSLCLVDYLKNNALFDKAEILLNTLSSYDYRNKELIYEKEFENIGALNLVKGKNSTSKQTVLVMGRIESDQLTRFLRILKRTHEDEVVVITDNVDQINNQYCDKVVDINQYSLLAGNKVVSALDVVSEKHKEQFLITLKSAFKKTPVEEFITRQRAAILNWLRVNLIGVTKRPLQLRVALSNYLDSNLSIVCSTANDIQPLMGFDFSEKVLGNVQVICLSQDSSSRKLALAFAKENLVESVKFNIFDKKFVSFDDQEFTTLANKYLSTERSPFLSSRQEIKYLFVTNWMLKTVGPTVAPVVRELLSSVKVDVVNVNAGTFNNSIIDSVDVDDWRGDNLRVASFLDGYKNIAPRKIAQMLGDKIAIEFCSQLPIIANDIDIKKQFVAKLSKFCSKLLWNYYWFEADVMDYLNSSVNSIVSVCPGRGTEAMIAQDAARYLGVKSVDIQNAYMSDGYTYTAPHGEIVTAIDSWSKDLFTEHFGLREEQIRVVGTPRFDSISKLSKMSDADFDELPFGFKGDALVVFATQPVEEEKTLRVIELLSKASVEGKKLDIIIKLHPRDSDEYFMQIRRFVESLVTEHNIVVDRGFDIHHLIMKSDLVVTMFSNVGIEAAIAGKNLLVTNLDKEDMALPLDKMGVGLNAYHENEFLQGVSDLLIKEEVRKSVLKRREEYFKLNPQFLRGNSVETISQLLKDLAAEPKVSD